MRSKQPNKQSVEICTVRKKMHTAKKDWKVATITLMIPCKDFKNKNLQNLTPDFLSINPIVPSKTFANLREAKIIFCHILKYSRIRDNQKQNETILDLCWQLSLKLGSPKTSITIRENTV